MSGFLFRGMSVLFRARDLLVPRRKVLEEAHLSPGQTVLDFGCGPGSYLRDAARMVGPAGRVYALDLHPLAIRSVSRMAERMGLHNLRPIQSDCQTELADASVDSILLHDTFHILRNPREVLAELHRVLKKEGVLSFSDHHMGEQDITAGMTQGGLFRLASKGRRTYTFVKN
jgi:ubiquinone/menaquinone biosynthesis C-methylase UbiE